MTKPRIEIFAEKTKLIAGVTQNVDVLIRITPPEQSGNGSKRPELNLGIALDRSGSMQGKKMKEARDAAKFCIDQLLSTDHISAVIFDDQIDVLFTNQPLVDPIALKRGIDRIEARNSTALHEGWVQAGLQVSEDLSTTGINRVLLITDGQANVGETNVDRIVSHAAELAGKGISTTTIGIGTDFNEDLLLPMAEAGGGNGWHVREPEDMVSIFETELHGLVRQFAKNVQMTIITADGVRITDSMNDFPRGEAGEYTLPNLLSGSPLDIVLRLEVQAGSTRSELLKIELDYTSQGNGNRDTSTTVFVSEFDSRDAVKALESNKDVRKAVQLLMNA